jgi:Mrp family chromosome partitioning ATPase
VSETSWGPDGDDNGVGGPGLVGSLWRYRLVIAVVAVSAAVVGSLAALLLPAKYEAHASLYLRDPGSPAVLTLEGDSPQSGDHAVFMATEAELAGSDAVYGRALQLLGRAGTPADIKESVVVGTSSELTSSIAITATASDPVEAARVANAVGNAYQQVAAERGAGELDGVLTRLREVRAQREAELDALEAQPRRSASVERQALHVANLIGTLQVHEDNVAAQAALYGTGVESFQQASPPTSSSQPAPALLALLGGVIGLVVAGGWAWWAAGRDRRVEAEEDAGAILGVPLLGETPQLGAEMRGTGGPRTPPGELDPVAAEAYHFVLASLEHALSRMGGKVVAVVSAGQGDGKTVTVLNLARAALREGRMVRLVDADERTGRLSRLWNDGEPSDVIDLGHAGEEAPAVALVGTASQNGSGEQGGPSERNGHHPAVFVRSNAFSELISPSGEPADIVLIDTPALLDVSETVAIADRADAVLLVVNRGTSLSDLRRARERLAFTDTPVVGYLLNRGLSKRPYADAGGRGSRARLWRRTTGRGEDAV